MNTQRILRSVLLASALISTSAQAADPQPVAPSATDLQALMAMLNKLVAQSAAAAETAPNFEPAPEPEPQPAPAPAVNAPAAALRQPLSTALKSGSLTTGGLAPSGGLGGHGPEVVARLTAEAWRLLFPVKQPDR